MGFYGGYSKTRCISRALTVIFSICVIMPAEAGFSQAAFWIPQRGMCYATWDKDRFATPYSDESLEKLKSIGVEYLSISPTYYQEQYNSTKIRSTDQTPTKRSLKHVIKKAQELGLKVMVKPHIDLIDKYDGTYWRADIGFATDKDWEEWFKNYEKIILSYAKICEKYEVDIFCIGTELSFTTQRDAEWRGIIQKVRAKYSGKLVYAANWDNFKNVKFWDELDYVGIDAYFPLTYEANPSLEDLKAG